jgi:hypothetical protein
MIQVGKQLDKPEFDERRIHYEQIKKNSVLDYLLCSFFCKVDYRFPDFAIYILPV